MDALRDTCRKLVATGDVESVAEMAKDAYAHAVAMRNALRPHEQVFNAATGVLLEFLVAQKRSVVNDDEFDIELAPVQSTCVTDEAALYDALHALRIDGKPLPPALLAEAARLDEPPPPPMPVKKTNLTKIKPLVKRYGAPVQDCIDAHVTYVPKARALIFRPKESPDSGEQSHPDRAAAVTSNH